MRVGNTRAIISLGIDLSQSVSKDEKEVQDYIVNVLNDDKWCGPVVPIDDMQSPKPKHLSPQDEMDLSHAEKLAVKSGILIAGVCESLKPGYCGDLRQMILEGGLSIYDWINPNANDFKH